MIKDDVIGLIDIGSSKTAGAVIDLESDSFDLLALSVNPCKGMKKGVITDLDNAATSVDLTLRDLQRTIGREIESIFVTVSGPHVESSCVQGFVPIYPRTRPIGSDDVLQVVNHSRQVLLSPDREQVQAIPREFRIDSNRGIKRPIGMNGAKLEVVTFLVSGQSAQLQNIERCVTMSGKKVTQMVLGPLASALGSLSHDEQEMGSVCVDIGAGKTDFSIFSGGTIAFSTCIALGGNHVTSDIANLLRTTTEEAERLKINHATAFSKNVSEQESVDVLQIGQSVARPLQRRVLCEIVESRMKELATFVQQQIDKSGLGSMLQGGIILTGGGSKLAGTSALFESHIRHGRIRLGDPLHDLPPNSGEVNCGKASLSALVGLSQFAFRLDEDEFAPTSGVESWKQKVRTLWSFVGGKP